MLAAVLLAQVVLVHPAPRAVDVPADAPIVFRFDAPVDRDAVRAGLSVFGRWSGAMEGSVSFSDGDQRVSFTPSRRFSAGETVTASLSVPARLTVQFWIETAPSPMRFRQVQDISTRLGGEATSRAYGGIASDVNRDGWLDLTIVNEDTADLRVFVNRADASGTFESEPSVFPVGRRASPSEPADFDGDGNLDVVVANIDDGTLSLLLGDGLGGFGPQRVLRVGAAPRGVAVLDFDADGDVDIVSTNAGSGKLSLLRNDGRGRFGEATFLDTPADGEWALGAADMNEDGFLDLVVGARSSEQVLVLLADGAGGFDHASTTAGVGDVWMLVLGDVNADGHEDVVAVSSREATGTVLFGDGRGTLDGATRYPIDPNGLATDLGDLDGDGDLDWVTSSFGGSWLLFENQGDGSFVLGEIFASPAAASCALLFDADNDGDLDIALIDEIADRVLVMINQDG